MSAVSQRTRTCDGMCCSPCRCSKGSDLTEHVTEVMEGDRHTTTNTRSEGSPAYSTVRILLLSALVLFIQPGCGQEPHQNKFAKGTFHLWKEPGISWGESSGLNRLCSHRAAGILSSAPPQPPRGLRRASAPLADGQPWSSAPVYLVPGLFSRRALLREQRQHLRTGTAVLLCSFPPWCMVSRGAAGAGDGCCPLPC